jgi:hypothetical protein
MFHNRTQHFLSVFLAFTLGEVSKDDDFLDLMVLWTQLLTKTKTMI